MIALLYAERGSSPPSMCDALHGTYRRCALDSLLPIVPHILPFLASTHLCLEHLQLVRGFEAALDYGVPTMGWQQKKFHLPMDLATTLVTAGRLNPWLLSA